MNTPGFIVKNETIWPLQISLNQVGPLYYGVVPSGQSFVRSTGAVWFTIKAAVFLDEEDRITVWDAVWPIGAIVGSVLLTAVTAGAAAYAGGPALAAAGAAGISGVTGLSSASALATATAASSLVGAGFSAGAALSIGGAVVAGTTAAASTTVTAALKDIFSPNNTSDSKAGCYAGYPWPFRTTVTPYRVIGGPTYREKSSAGSTAVTGVKGPWDDLYDRVEGSVESSSIVGEYEVHGGGQNDWHYVTISHESDKTFKWANRAGVSWTLTATADPTKFNVGGDCPYYNQGHRVMTVKKQPIVEAIGQPLQIVR